MKTIWLPFIFFIAFTSCKMQHTEDGKPIDISLSEVIYTHNKPLKINTPKHGPEIYTLVTQWDLANEDKDSYYIENTSFEKSNRLCPGEIEKDLPRIGSCTVFFINPTTAITAGHCLIGTSNKCDNFFITQYENPEQFSLTNENLLLIPKEKTLKCSKVINLRKKNKVNDIAILKFERPVSEQRISLINRNDFRELFSVTHQMGLPATYITGFVRGEEVVNKKIKVEMDFFDGSSGSPVLDVDSKKLIGILVKGEKDFVLDSQNKCRKIKRCKDHICRGEDVLLLNQISQLKKYL